MTTAEPTRDEAAIERRTSEIARSMPDMFPQGYARYLAECEYDEGVAR